MFITDGAEHALTGYCMYFLRANTKRTLGEETFQRDILAGLVNATNTETLLWNIERTFSNIFIPFLNSRAMADRISEELFRKVKQELNPCLRSFARSGDYSFLISSIRGRGSSYFPLKKCILFLPHSPEAVKKRKKS